MTRESSQRESSRSRVRVKVFGMPSRPSPTRDQLEQNRVNISTFLMKMDVLHGKFDKQDLIILKFEEIFFRLMWFKNVALWDFFKSDLKRIFCSRGVGIFNYVVLDPGKLKTNFGFLLNKTNLF